MEQNLQYNKKEIIKPDMNCQTDLLARYIGEALLMQRERAWPIIILMGDA